MTRGRWIGPILAAPAVSFILVFFILPGGFLFLFSFWSFQGFRVIPGFSLDNYIQSLTSPLFLRVTWNAILIGLTTSAVSLALSIPVGYYLVYVNRSKLIFYLIIITWFSSYLVRVYAWRTLLGTQGLANNLLLQAGLIDQPIEALLFSRFAVTIALTQIYLPFCILLVISAFSEIKAELVEAARDLGTGPFGAFARVIAPNAASGLVGAFMLTFLLVAGDYVTPQMLGGSSGQTTGFIIADQFRKSANWPLGAAQAIVMFLVSFLIYAAVLGIGRATGVVPSRRKVDYLPVED